MSKIKGENFRVFVGAIAAANAIPEATNCSCSINGNTEDSSTKDSEGLYALQTMVSKSWNVQVDSFEATPAELKAIVTAFNGAAPTTVGWDQTAKTAGGQNRTPVSASFKRSGQAILNDVTFTFNDRATVTTSLQYQGTGALS